MTYELIVPHQMYQADKATIDSGIDGIELMRAAGGKVADVCLAENPSAHKVLVVCGTGNNGGDGFVAADILAKNGLEVDLMVIGDKGSISGDARLAIESMSKAVTHVDAPALHSYDMIIDGMLGAGLDREVRGKFADAIEHINSAKAPTVSIDLPSGVNGATGEIMGLAVEADITVTFFRKKPGHLLLPGRIHCGKVHLCQIGIPESTLDLIGPTILENVPYWWIDHYPLPEPAGHKYHRGHTIAVSGAIEKSGAARLMAGAALRIGSGLVTIASPGEVMLTHACQLTSLMLAQADTPEDLGTLLNDVRINTVCLGPGLPPNEKTIEMVEAALPKKRNTVLDAGAISAFQGDPDRLFEAIGKCGSSVVLTPHEGEFNHLFRDLLSGRSKPDAAFAAAELSGATVILKGADTVVACPTGEISICDNAPPWLATAGSGDVLTGMVAGLLAQGMPVFEAASAAVWLHAEAANIAGPGLISSDLDQGMRMAIAALVSDWRSPFAKSNLLPS